MPQEQEIPEPQEQEVLPEGPQEIQIMDLTTVPELNSDPAGDYATGSSAPPQDEKVKSRGISTKPPTAEEWQDFLGSTVFRLLTEGYLYLALFRHIDESELTERELAKIKLTRDELRNMAAPVATVASKNKLARKHGRVIIASAESYESLLDLFFWMKNVNKIARKYRKPRTVSDTSEVIEGEVYNGPVPGSDGPVGSAGPNVGGIHNRGTG